jgi:hypothetical protein
VFHVCEKKPEDAGRPSVIIDVVGPGVDELDAPASGCATSRVYGYVSGVRLVLRRISKGVIRYGTRYYPLTR